MSALTPIVESKSSPTEAALPVARRGLLMVAVMGATMIQILDSTIANVAIPHMQTSLGATRDSVTWVLTSYILASAVIMPITGWLSDRVGSRRLFLFSVGGFIIASMLCGVSANLTQMVIFRILQGVCAAFIGPLSQTILLDINPPDRAGKAMTIWGMGIMLAPIFGPMIGGFLTENYNWRWVFYINLPIGIPTFLLLWWLLPSRAITQRGFDIIGFSMLAIGLAALQLMLDRGQQVDWFDAWEIRIEAIVALSALWIFFLHSRWGKNPLFSTALTSNANFMIALPFMLLVGIIMMAVFALLPPMLQGLRGYSVLDTGIILAPRGLGMLFAMSIVARLTMFVDPRVVIAFGCTLVATSLYLMTGWSLDITAWDIGVSGAIQGLGLGLMFMPLNLLAFSTLGPQHRTDGSSLSYLFRNLGGSIGISISTTLLARNIQINHEELGGRITSFNLPSIDLSSVDRFGDVGEAAMRIADAQINQQAAMIAYLDDFKAMMVVTIIAIPFLMLLKVPKKAG